MRTLPFPRLALACLLAATLACAAPSAERATGEVAKAVEASLAGGTERFDHKTWGVLLMRGTKDGLVNYPFMQEHRSELDAYLKTIADAGLNRLAPAHLEALLIDAYNAYTVKSILDHPEVSSIRDIPGVWTKVRHRVGGFDLTLDEIEHRILRPFFRDPRIHFALNCASRSCAPFPIWAYDGERIDEQLEDRADSFLSDPNNVQVEGTKLLLSRYFDWYGGDFTASGWKGSEKTIVDYVGRYALPQVKVFIERYQGKPQVGFLDYDWSLNAAVPPVKP